MLSMYTQTGWVFKIKMFKARWWLHNFWISGSSWRRIQKSGWIAWKLKPAAHWSGPDCALTTYSHCGTWAWSHWHWDPTVEERHSYCAATIPQMSTVCCIAPGKSCIFIESQTIKAAGYPASHGASFCLFSRREPCEVGQPTPRLPVAW